MVPFAHDVPRYLLAAPVSSQEKLMSEPTTDDVDDELTPLDCPPMKPISIPCRWKGFSGNRNTCRLGFDINREHITLEDFTSLFNQRRLDVVVTTADVEQPTLFDAGPEDYTVEGSADTMGVSINGDHYCGGLTFNREEVAIELLANCGGRSGTMIVRNVESLPQRSSKKGKPHTSVVAGRDRPAGQPTLAALGRAALETELAQLTNEAGKPILSEAVAFTLSQAGFRTCEDLQTEMMRAPDFWRSDMRKKVKGLGEVKLEQLIDAYQMFMAGASEPDGGRRLCGKCGTVHIDKSCPSCGSEFFSAIHDTTLDDQDEWPPVYCVQNVIASSGPITAMILLRESEFGTWHYGVLITVVQPGGTEVDEYGFNPTISANQLDSKWAEQHALKALLLELDGVEVDYPGVDVEACRDAVAELIW